MFLANVTLHQQRRTAQTGKSALSQMTKLSQAGQHFRHHFASQALLPEIIGATGRDGLMLLGPKFAVEPC